MIKLLSAQIHDALKIIKYSLSTRLDFISFKRNPHPVSGWKWVYSKDTVQMFIWIQVKWVLRYFRWVQVWAHVASCDLILGPKFCRQKGRSASGDFNGM